MPPAISGERGHDATFHVASVLVWGFGLDPEAALELLREWNATCQPPWSERELVHKINSALSVEHRHPRGYLLGGGVLASSFSPLPQAMRTPARAALNAEARATILAEGDQLHDLWEASPVRLNGPCTEAIIDCLFPGNPRLCVGASVREFTTRRREDLRGELSHLAFIVPSPMTAQTGRTLDGRVSEHTLDNTEPRRFLVIEFDSGSSDDHAALLLHLALFAPLVLAVHSGGKSLHGWFYCVGECEGVTRRFMRYAVSLGADRATWTRSQFVRIPDGQRDNGERQAVWFFNPAAR